MKDLLKTFDFVAFFSGFTSVNICSLHLTSPEAGGWWNTKGCDIVSKHYGYTVCHCNHTTNFAVLLQVYEAQVIFFFYQVITLDISVGCYQQYVQLQYAFMFLFMSEEHRE